VLSQSFNNYEIIISDNSDNNDCKAIYMNNFLNYKNIYFEKNKSNIGPILNWRNALDKAKGFYSIILPDDDYLINPFYFEDGIKYLKENNVKLLFTSCILGYNNDYNVTISRNQSELINGIDFINGFWKKYNVPTIANIFETNLRDINSFYDNQILYSDIEFWLKSMSFSDVFFYNIPSVYYSMHSSNIVLNLNKERLIYNSKFIDSVIEFYIRNNTNLNHSKVKNNLILNYIAFTSSINNIISIDYIIQIFAMNKTNIFKIGIINILKLIFRTLKHICIIMFKTMILRLTELKKKLSF
jgi:hypothetical protein